MFYYKVTYTATQSKFAMFKVILAHSLQDANYLFKTFHEGRLGNTRVLSFEGIEKSLAESVVKSDIVEKASSYVWKGKEEDFKQHRPLIKREAKADRRAQKELNKLAEFLVEHYPKLTDNDQFIKDGIAETAINMIVRLQQGVTVDTTSPAPDDNTSGTPPNSSAQPSGSSYPENHPDFDNAQKTEI